MNRNLPVCKSCGIVYNGAAGLDDLTSNFENLSTTSSNNTTKNYMRTTVRKSRFSRPQSATLSSNRRTMLMTNRPKSAHVSSSTKGKETQKNGRIEFVPKGANRRRRSVSPTQRNTTNSKKSHRSRSRPKSAVEQRSSSLQRKKRNAKARPQSAHITERRIKSHTQSETKSEEIKMMTVSDYREAATQQLINTYGGRNSRQRQHNNNERRTKEKDDTPRIKEKAEEMRRVRATSRSRLGIGNNRPRSSKRHRKKVPKKKRPKSAHATLSREDRKENIQKENIQKENIQIQTYSRDVEDETASLLHAALAKDAWRMRGKFSNKEERRKHQKKFLQKQIDKVMANLETFSG